MKFYQWYCQALGSILGIISCIYCYLKGDLLIYSNLDGNFDMINFNGILASYILYPLCFLTFVLAILLSKQSINEKKIINIEVSKINSFLVYLTVLVGILGCGIYFIVPFLLLLLKNTLYTVTLLKFKISNKHMPINNINQNFKELQYDEKQLIDIKNQMAIDLLDKNANINFIIEVTGLSQDYISNLKRQDTLEG